MFVFPSFVFLFCFVFSSFSPFPLFFFFFLNIYVLFLSFFFFLSARFYSNPQTDAFCEFFGIDNKLAQFDSTNTQPVSNVTTTTAEPDVLSAPVKNPDEIQLDDLDEELQNEMAEGVSVANQKEDEE